MIIIGIDPGTLITGYGLIRVHNNCYSPIDYGCIRPPANLNLTDRYLILFNSLEVLLEKYQPHAFVIETQFVKKNVQSSLKLGMARGVLLIAAKRRDIAVFEYAPTKAKQAVVGTGRASKQQVQGMVQRLLNLTKIPEPEDAADALALAICHANTLRFCDVAKFQY